MGLSLDNIYLKVLSLKFQIVQPIIANLSTNQNNYKNSKIIIKIIKLIRMYYKRFKSFK